MIKLLNAFRDQQTVENAKKIVNHLVRHPMADSFCDKQERELIAMARQLVKGN